jgi:hypothetical protein
MGWNPTDVELTDDQLSDVPDNFMDTDDILLQDLATPLLDPPKLSGATRQISYTGQYPLNQTLPKARLRQLLVSSSSLLVLSNPL